MHIKINNAYTMDRFELNQIQLIINFCEKNKELLSDREQDALKKADTTLTFLKQLEGDKYKVVPYQMADDDEIVPYCF